MAFKFWCECGYDSGVKSGADIGPKNELYTCASCGHVETDGDQYFVTNEQFHNKDMDCPGCGKKALFSTVVIGRSRFNAQVGINEASAVAIHPVTKEVVYCFGDDPSKPVPEMYKKEGFEKHTFHHYKELEQFCRAHGQVNDIEGDWHKDDGYFEEDLARRRKAEKERRERYAEEREKAKLAHEELRRQGR